MNGAVRASSHQAGRELRLVHAAYVVFHFAALPIVLLAWFFIPVVWLTWPQRFMGVMEGPVPTDAEVIECTVALGLFTLVYIFTFLYSKRLVAARLAWLPFAVQVPALLWLVILRLLWSSDPVTDRLGLSLYPALLLVILAFGIVTSFRLHAPNRNA